MEQSKDGTKRWEVYDPDSKVIKDDSWSWTRSGWALFHALGFVGLVIVSSLMMFSG